jgi:hypothetical protein
MFTTRLTGSSANTVTPPTNNGGTDARREADRPGSLTIKHVAQLAGVSVSSPATTSPAPDSSAPTCARWGSMGGRRSWRSERWRCTSAWQNGDQRLAADRTKAPPGNRKDQPNSAVGSCWRAASVLRAICQKPRLPPPHAAPRRPGSTALLTWLDVVRRRVLRRCMWGPRCVHTAAATESLSPARSVGWTGWRMPDFPC